MILQKNVIKIEDYLEESQDVFIQVSGIAGDG